MAHESATSIATWANTTAAQGSLSARFCASVIAHWIRPVVSGLSAHSRLGFAIAAPSEDDRLEHDAHAHDRHDACGHDEEHKGDRAEPAFECGSTPTFCRPPGSTPTPPGLRPTVASEEKRRSEEDRAIRTQRQGRLWMAHCHIVEHHESGMMFSFTVRP
jgi:hypothetical protein